MKKSSFAKLKTLVKNIDKPTLVISAIGMIFALGIAGYGNLLKARLDTAPLAVTTVRTTTPSATITPSMTPSPSPTASATPTPSPSPAATKKSVVTYVTHTAPQSSVSSLKPHTTASSTPATSSAPTTSAVSYTSSNWAGYLATGSSYTAVNGSWTVPSPTGNSTSTSADAAWVGIGGVTSNDLIQAGTLDTISASGQVTVSAFYEILPAAARLITMTVSPGDVMAASVTETGTNLWQITITDQTTSQTYSKSLSYASSLSSAEWIEEDPSTSGGQQMAFDRFGSVSFTGGSTVANGSSATIAGAGGLPITMLIGGATVATPSAVSGGSFTVSRNG